MDSCTIVEMGKDVPDKNPGINTSSGNKNNRKLL